MFPICGKCEKRNYCSRSSDCIYLFQSSCTFKFLQSDTRKKARQSSCHENICTKDRVNHGEKVTEVEMQGQDRLHYITFFDFSQESWDVAAGAPNRIWQQYSMKGQKVDLYNVPEKYLSLMLFPFGQVGDHFEDHTSSTLLLVIKEQHATDVNKHLGAHLVYFQCHLCGKILSYIYRCWRHWLKTDLGERGGHGKEWYIKNQIGLFWFWRRWSNWHSFDIPYVFHW